MFDWNAPIVSLDQAEAYFKAMGCNHFRMSRENFNRYDEYNALEIGKETEESWRAEKFDLSLGALADEASKRELWSRHASMCDLYLGIGQERLRKLSFEKVVSATKATTARATNFDRILIAETILGRATYRDDGLIYEARRFNRADVVGDLFELVSDLLDFEDANQERERRRKDAVELKIKLRETPQVFDMPKRLAKIIGHLPSQLETRHEAE